MVAKAWDSRLSLPGLIVERRAVVDGIVQMFGRLAAPHGICPSCGTPSGSCHSRYDRTLSDLPISGARVELRLSVRRFRCGHAPCSRRTFSEPLPSAFGRRYGRRIERCEALLRAVAVALGGRPGARMMARLAVPWSRDTMLRVLRRGDPTAEPPPPARVIGIDDFAWRRGHDYGSIIVDLERRQVIDLLPDRQRETVIAWLQENQQVEVICRDRGAGYIAAATEAAPQARQVADRWHLFENASAAFLAAVRSEMPCLRRALAPSGPIDPETLTRAERLQWDGAQVREALNRQILELAEQGMPIKRMARMTGVSRQTIRKVLRGQRHDTFRSRGSSLDAWSLALEAEWNAGCRVGAELWRRLKASGFAGSLRVVSEWATRRRRDEKLGHTAGSSLSARTIARSLTTERETGSAQTAMINAVIETAVPALVVARDVLDRFHAMMRSRDEARLDPWLVKAANTKLAAFAAGVEVDKDAVTAAISSPWSSGHVEGNVNRLKSIKRQMYGRAKIDLLKARIMADA
ncbi:MULTISPECIES: ISL3 family transposase [Novosphingobium]